jgi:hypothetical protein
MTEIVKVYPHRGAKRQELKPQVEADEETASQQLGGPVNRAYKFINGGADLQVTWTLK